jgi:hypothetical protein
MDGPQVQLLYGGMDTKRREQLRLAFQEPPDQNPVRILLATDAASEGIDLHEHWRDGSSRSAGPECRGARASRTRES